LADIEKLLTETSFGHSIKKISVSLLKDVCGDNSDFLKIIELTLNGIIAQEVVDENDLLLYQLRAIEVLSEVFESSLEVFFFLKFRRQPEMIQY
jgi:hypothetical protein